ncbi:MAG: hypothetical protein U1E65_02955 [Myxococcota bacterium]
MKRLLWVLPCLLAMPSTGWAVQRTMPYQGVIERDGIPQTGAFDLRFAIFLDVVTDASCLTRTPLTGCGVWSEQQDAVAVGGGRFSVSLGSRTPLAADAFRAGEPFLAVAVRGPGDAGFTLLGGRQRLGASPFAMRSEIALPPIGAVIAWHKSMAGVPALDPDSGWVECDGQTINDPGSPMNGQVVPDLNGGARFLRGGATSGVFQVDNLQGHRHIDSGHSHTFLRPPFNNTDTPVNPLVPMNYQGNVPNFAHRDTTSVATANIGLPTDDSPQNTVRYGNETRPTNMSVVWIMRIK